MNLHLSLLKCSLVVLLGACSAGPSDGPEAVGQAAVICVKPVSNLVIRANTTLCPGSYSIGDPEGDGAIQIKANNVQLTIS